jgi:hypothetical protein
VLSTVRHAGDLDYRLVVVRDCCADPDAEVHAMLLDIVIAKQAAAASYFASTASSDNTLPRYNVNTFLNSATTRTFSLGSASS